jgi:uncharacterized protein YxeA
MKKMLLGILTVLAVFFVIGLFVDEEAPDEKNLVSEASSANKEESEDSSDDSFFNFSFEYSYTVDMYEDDKVKIWGKKEYNSGDAADTIDVMVKNNTEEELRIFLQFDKTNKNLVIVVTEMNTLAAAEEMKIGSIKTIDPEGDSNFNMNIKYLPVN